MYCRLVFTMITLGMSLLSGTLLAQDVTSPLQQSLQDIGVGARWKYNDWESAKAAANRSQKPILALFR